MEFFSDTEVGLTPGLWEGTRENQQEYWLRWWDQDGNLLLWGTERIAQNEQPKSRR